GLLGLRGATFISLLSRLDARHEIALGLDAPGTQPESLEPHPNHHHPKQRRTTARTRGDTDCEVNHVALAHARPPLMIRRWSNTITEYVVPANVVAPCLIGMGGEGYATPRSMQIR